MSYKHLYLNTIEEFEMRHLIIDCLINKTRKWDISLLPHRLRYGQISLSVVGHKKLGQTPMILFLSDGQPHSGRHAALLWSNNGENKYSRGIHYISGISQKSEKYTT
jgi:hypothetical protein